MSSTTAAAKGSTSDKVDVSFATDDEGETTSSSAEESEEETTSSSGSESGEEEKSDEDGDADDESEMPTFTLSLQPSTGAVDQDDILPDLSTKNSLQEMHQQTVVEKGSHVETVTTQLASVTVKTGSAVSSETNPKPSVPEKKEGKVVTTVDKKEKESEEEEEEEEESEESEETETSEEDTEKNEEEKDKKSKEQSLPLSSSSSASSKHVSTKIDTKEELSNSFSKVSVTESKLSVQEVKKEQTSAVSVETKTALREEKSAKDTKVRVTEKQHKNISGSKSEEKSSKQKEAVVVEELSKVEVETEEKLPDVSRTAAAKAVELEITQTSNKTPKSVENPDTKSTMKKKKDSEHEESTSDNLKADVIETKSAKKGSKLLDTAEIKAEEHSKAGETLKTSSKSRKTEANAKESTQEVKSAAEEQSEKATKTSGKSKAQEAKSESAKADTVRQTFPATETNDLKNKDSVKETELSAVKSPVPNADGTKKSPIDEVTSTKTSAINKVKSTEQNESTGAHKSSKLRKTKTETKSTKHEVKGAVQEETSASINVETKISTGGLDSSEMQTIQPADATPNPKIKSDKHGKSANKNDELEASSSTTTASPSAAAAAEEEEARETDKTNDKTNDTNRTISANTAKITVSESTETLKEVSNTEALEEKPSLTKTAKHPTTDSQKSETKSAVAAESAVASALDDKESTNIVNVDVLVKGENTSSTKANTETNLTPVTEPTKDVTGTEADKTKSLTEASEGGESKFDDVKVNGVENDNEKPLEDVEFRPRRNSIDEFIKKILAEARDEQKKILDSCAVSSETPTAENGVSSVSAATDIPDGGVPLSRGAASEPKQQQPVVNGVDLGLSTSTGARRSREDFDIDDELADISRYYAKRTLIDRSAVADNDDEESTEFTTTRPPAKSNSVANGDSTAADDEPVHFVPLRRDATAMLVRESARPVKIMIDQQTSVIRQLSETSRAVDDLDNEIRQLRQSYGGREALYASIGSAIRDELRLYEMELTAAGSRLDQQRLPGGGRFVREQFVSQCAAELFQRSSTVNGPRLDRAYAVDDWSRVGRRRSGSFSTASVDEDVGAPRSSARTWIHDRDPTDLTIQYRHSRAGSVASDRSYSSLDVVDEPRATTSSLLSRLTAFNGSTTAAEFDVPGRGSRASSETPRASYLRPQTSYTDDWVSSGGGLSYSIGRQYAPYSHDSSEDTSGELDVGYRVSTTRQPTYYRYQPLSVDAAQPSRLYTRRGSLQGYSSYDSGDAGSSFNSRFLSRVREKKALGETVTRQTSSERPFRSRFLKSSNATSTTYSASQYAENDDN